MDEVDLLEFTLVSGNAIKKFAPSPRDIVRRREGELEAAYMFPTCHVYYRPCILYMYVRLRRRARRKVLGARSSRQYTPVVLKQEISLHFSKCFQNFSMLIIYL